MIYFYCILIFIILLVCFGVLNTFIKSYNIEKFSATQCDTACYNKTDDFDEWCRFNYPLSSIPVGNSINNVGAKNIYYDADGVAKGGITNCKENEACATCDVNHIEEVSKLNPINNNINYNIFTDCHLLSSNVFLDECKTKLNNSTAAVEQIMGYDCLPGYGRGKCILPDDKVYETNTIKYNNNNFYKNKNQYN